MATDLLKLPAAVARCLYGCGQHLRRHPDLARDPKRQKTELCPECARTMAKAACAR